MWASRGRYPYNEGAHLLIMANLYSYADDSGTHRESPYCLVLGYVASPRKWNTFRRDWEAALGNVPEFRSKEFFDRHRWQSSKSPYHGWGEARARKFLDGLVATIEDYGLTPLGGAVKVADFKAFSSEMRRLLTGAKLWTITHEYKGEIEVITKLARHEGSPERPYFVPFMGFLVEAMRISAKAHDAKVHLYFDRQKDVEARALEAFNSFRNGCPSPTAANLKSIAYADSKDELPLQAADLYAYVWNRQLTETMNEELACVFKRLTRKKQTIFVADRRYCLKLLAVIEQDRRGAIRKAVEFSS